MWQNSRVRGLFSCGSRPRKRAGLIEGKSALDPCGSFRVQEIGVLEAKEHQLRHNLVEELLRLEHPGESARPDDARLLASEHLACEAGDDVPNGANMPVIESRLDTFDRGAAEHG